MNATLNISVLGSGAWGTALACAMARAGHQVTVWGRNSKVLREISEKHTNSAFLGEIQLDNGLLVESDLEKAVSRSDVILLATPAQSISTMAELLKELIDPGQIIIVCAKGIDRNSGKTPAELISHLVEPENIGALSGPGFAADVARDLPTAVTLAFSEMERAMKLANLLSSDNFRIYASDDITGVELGGALKNVLALAVGAARGMGLGASAEAALIARGFGELRRLAEKMGGKPQTLSGLSGLGDLVLTASSSQSRNFSYGVALGRGDNVSGMPLAEGVFTAQIAAELARKNQVDAPVIQAVGDVIANRLTARDAVRQLLSRPLKAENQ